MLLDIEIERCDIMCKEKKKNTKSPFRVRMALREQAKRNGNDQQLSNTARRRKVLVSFCFLFNLDSAMVIILTPTHLHCYRASFNRRRFKLFAF